MEMNKTPAQVLSPSKQMTVSRSEIIAAYMGSGTIPLISASRIYYRALLRKGIQRSGHFWSDKSSKRLA